MSQRSGTGVLLVIAIFKLVKAVTLVSLGVAALSLVDDSHAFTTLRHAARELRLNPDNRLINRAIGKISGLDDRRLEQLGAGTFVYAAVFLVEGSGLLLRKSWAEYLTIVVTGSFIPFEIYEMIKQPSVLKGVGIAVNAAIVAYLVLRVWRERHEAR